MAEIATEWVTVILPSTLIGWTMARYLYTLIQVRKPMLPYKFRLKQNLVILHNTSPKIHLLSINWYTIKNGSVSRCNISVSPRLRTKILTFPSFFHFCSNVFNPQTLATIPTMNTKRYIGKKNLAVNSKLIRGQVLLFIVFWTAVGTIPFLCEFSEPVYR